MLVRQAAVAFTLLSFTACTMLRPIEDFSPSRIRQQVEVGDTVRIVALTGATYTVKVTEVAFDHLVGRTPGGKSYKIFFEAIKTIEVREVSGWAIAWSAFGSAVVILYVATLYALYVFFESLD